jgi:hypothetical protein
VRSALLHGRRAASAALLGGALLAAAGGCAKRQPAIEYMPNMAYGPRVAAQAEDPLRPGYSVERLPVEGPVPRDITPYRFAQADTTQAMAALVNPLPRTAEVIGRGQRVYMNTCVVCHGPRGDGQGTSSRSIRSRRSCSRTRCGTGPTRGSSTSSRGDRI